MTMLASTDAELDLDGAETLLKLIEHMEDLDDVQNVYSNAKISDEIASQL
jgi:transcriptional/translational regulatory protein YebC/TACO1